MSLQPEKFARFLIKEKCFFQRNSLAQRSLAGLVTPRVPFVLGGRPALCELLIAREDLWQNE
jgi:hypothetical protein